MKGLSPWSRAYLGLVVFSLAGSLFSRLAHLDPGPIAPIAAFLTLVLGAVAAFEPYVRAVPKKSLFALVLLLLLGTLVELAGVTYGLPFGDYAYTDRWAPVIRLPGVGWFPLQVPIAWLLMVGASTLAVGSRRISSWLIPIGSGLLAAVLDLVMEPVMAGPLGYWKWLESGPTRGREPALWAWLQSNVLPGGAPVLNFVGWFLTGALGALILVSLQARKVGHDANAWVVLAAHLLLTLGIGAILSL